LYKNRIILHKIIVNTRNIFKNSSVPILLLLYYFTLLLLTFALEQILLVSAWTH
jgi:hypothetical protein